ncbi:solute carrier family 4, anion exchanger, member 1 [Exophiala viscosa]|uniref:Solute carrier family 4, anion exchanger, member 1 n=1 Tax=Exophiala viscosa TaxID=2486360 RepID=A0AAN6IEW8_9EURO|nr:solute carrier family 4, anion exchanger, member 1 [Exophiala viscosa]
MATQTETITPSSSRPVPGLRRRSSSHSQRKPWQHTGRPSFHSSHSRPDPEELQRLSENVTRQTTRSSHRRSSKWYKIRWFRGMIDDVKRRAPFYWSDWKDAWDYRVVPATVYMYFANILPALAFSLDMFTKTHNSYGVNEVLLSSVLGCVVFSLFACQPLVIVGVTGPITVFSYTVYDIVVPSGTNYFAFMAWIGIWSLIMHWILAITNSCKALTYVTRFSCDTFGFYVAFIYLQKGIQVLTRQWGLAGAASAYLSIMVSLLVLAVAYMCGLLGNSKLLHRIPRKFIEDYGTPLTIIFFTGFVHIGHMQNVSLETLPTSKSFFPTANRGWFVHFWDISVGEVFLAIPFAMLLTILFWFDHNVSSLIAQGSEFPLRKPPGFHWDIFLLGLTTGVAGLLGIPFPNGLIPQAPFHTAALCATRQVVDEKAQGHVVRVTDHVVEQRVSNLAQGLLFLFTMSGPLLIVLHLIPQGVLAGLFFVMGVQALEGNGITQKLFFLARDKELTDASDPLARIERRSAIWAFVAIALLGFGATFAISQTIAAIGFPIVLLLLIIVRTWLMPKWFREEELRALDAPTAGPFVMESVGGAYGVSESSTPPLNESDENAVVDDTLERGESYELGTAVTSGKDVDDGGGSSARRPSHSDLQRPQIGMRKRSRSSLNRRGA